MSRPKGEKIVEKQSEVQKDKERLMRKLQRQRRG